jgi:hypothetical protein
MQSSSQVIDSLFHASAFGFLFLEGLFGCREIAGKREGKK